MAAHRPGSAPALPSASKLHRPGSSPALPSAGKFYRPASAPALPSVSSKNSPLGWKQPLCSVEVKQRRLVQEAVGHRGSRVLKQKKLHFSCLERGLEWERPRVAASLPAESLPPFDDVIKLAVGEFGLEFPPKKKIARGQPKHTHAFGGCGLFRSGPKLPLNRPRPPFVDYLPTVLPEPPREKEAQKEDPPTTEHSETPSSAGQSERQQTVETVEATPVMAKEGELEDKDCEQMLLWSEDEIRFVFQKFDADGDNELNTEDIPVILRYLGAKPSSEDVKVLIKEQMAYAKLDWQEFVDFIQRYQEHDINSMRQNFQSKDKDRRGKLGFHDVEACLRKMGCAATVQACQEAIQAIDKDSDSQVDFREFLLLRKHLRLTHGFMQVDIQEFRSLYQRAAGGKDRELSTNEIWRIVMFRGYQMTQKEIAQLAAEVDADGSGTVSFTELLIIIRRVHEYESEKMVGLMKAHGDGHQLKVEDLGIALGDLGYHVSEDAVFEILDLLGECKSEMCLTVEELGSFLQGYRRIEGFSIAELEALQQSFKDEDPTNTGSIGALQLGRILRSYGLSRTLQATQRLVEEIDFDGSGMLEMDEFIKLMRQLLQGEAKKRWRVFGLLDPGRTGQIAVEAVSRAVFIIEEIRPNPELIESARKAAIMPDATSISIAKFEIFYKHYRGLVMEEIKRNAGYSPKEIMQLKSIFATYDRDNSGTVERAELQTLIARYFPDATKSRQQQAEIQKLLTEFGTTAKDGGLDFSEFVWLMRKCDDMRDEMDVRLELEVVEMYNFTPEEVEGFRQIFSQSVSWTGELDIEALTELLSRVVDLTEEQTMNLHKLVRDLHPDGREASRFPQFLHLLKRLTRDDTLGINEAASRVVRWEAVRKQRQLQGLMERPAAM